MTYIDGKEDIHINLQNNMENRKKKKEKEITRSSKQVMNNDDNENITANCYDQIFFGTSNLRAVEDQFVLSVKKTFSEVLGSQSQS